MGGQRKRERQIHRKSLKERERQEETERSCKREGERSGDSVRDRDIDIDRQRMIRSQYIIAQTLQSTVNQMWTEGPRTPYPESSGVPASSPLTVMRTVEARIEVI